MARNRQLALTLQAPDGQTWDLSARVQLGDLSSLTEALEEDVLQFTHSDLELSLRDGPGFGTDPGFLEEMLTGVPAGAVWEVFLDRHRLTRRAKWERLWAGMLDLPFSLEIDRKAQVLTVQAFSYSKLLEQTSAAGIARDMGTQTGSVTGGTSSVTIQDTTLLAVDDEVTLDDGVNMETHPVSQILSPTEFTTSPGWTNTYTNAVFTLETPFPRNKLLSTLARSLFSAAGIPEVILELDQLTAGSSPLLTGFSGAGLTGQPIEFTTRPGVQAGPTAVVLSTRYEAPDPEAGWSSIATGITPDGDWSAYTEDAPSSLVSALPFGDYQKSTLPATDAYHAAGFDHANSYRWEIFRTAAGALELHRNGAKQADIDTTTAGYGFAGLDYDPGTGAVFIFYLRSGTSYLKKWTGSVMVPILTLVGDSASGIRSIGQVGMYAIQYRTGGGDVLRVMQNNQTYIPPLTLPRTLKLWTLRLLEDKLAVLYESGGSVKLLVWSWPGMGQLMNVVVSDPLAASDLRYITRWITPAGVQTLVGVVGQTLGDADCFILAHSYAGTVAYPDFSGKSCGGALTDLALLSLSYLGVDQHKVGKLQGRSAGAGVARELPTPDEHVSVPASEKHYKASVKVTGEQDDGTKIEEIRGDTGDSAHRLSLESPLITTVPVAQAVGDSYAGIYSTIRRLDQVELGEQEDAFHILDLITYQGKRYRCIEAETELEGREQSLTLLELPS